MNERFEYFWCTHCGQQHAKPVYENIGEFRCIKCHRMIYLYAYMPPPTPALREAVEKIVRVLERDNIDLHNHGYSDLIMCRDELKAALAASSEGKGEGK